MIKKLKIVSLLFIYAGVCALCYMYFRDRNNALFQEEIISTVFENPDAGTSLYVSNDKDYLGYIYIPRFNVKRLIEYGTMDSILDSSLVGMHELSGGLDENDLIILAGHNIASVFGNLRYLNNGDYVFINSTFSRRFIVYDKMVVSEYDFSYLINNRFNELLLITCTDNSGERLLVFLREDL